MRLARSPDKPGTNNGAAAPNPAELRQLDPICFPLNPQGDFSPPVPQGSGGRRLKSPVSCRILKTRAIFDNKQTKQNFLKKYFSKKKLE
jgi:hypothetical protein